MFQNQLLNPKSCNKTCKIIKKKLFVNTLQFAKSLQNISPRRKSKLYILKICLCTQFIKIIIAFGKTINPITDIHTSTT